MENINWSAAGDQLLAGLTSIAGKLVASLVVWMLSAFLIKLLLKGIAKSRLFTKMETTVSHFLQSFIKIILYVVMVVAIIGIMGVPMASVITVIASAGVAIGLALQGSLSNFAGGIMLLLFHPFRIGNFIEVAGHSGTVKDIGIFYTVLTTTDNREITIPNGTVMDSSIINVSVNDTRRVEWKFSVAYGNSPDRIKEILLDEIKKHELVLTDKEPFCRLTAQAESSLDFTLRAWCKKDDYWQLHFDILESVNNRFVEEGIEVPFNQLDVHVIDPQK